MALNPILLASELADFLGAIPQSEADCASAWRDLLDDYTLGLVPPPLPVPRAAALAAFQGALNGMAAPGAALGVFQGALAALAGSYAAAMPPAPPGGNLPPPAPPPLPFGPLYPDVNSFVSAFVPVLDAWFRTGTSNGVPWS